MKCLSASSKQPGRNLSCVQEGIPPAQKVPTHGKGLPLPDLRHLWKKCWHGEHPMRCLEWTVFSHAARTGQCHSSTVLLPQHYLDMGVFTSPGVLAVGMIFLPSASHEDFSSSSSHQLLPFHGPGHGLLCQRKGGCLLVWFF